MTLATLLAAVLWLSAFGPTPTPLPVATLPAGRPTSVPVPSPTPAQPGITSDQASKIDQIAMRELGAQVVPAMSIAVVRNGRVVYSHGYGFSSIELQQTVTDRSLFEIGSITKEFTAAAIMLLAEEGRINLDMPLSVFEPDYPRGKEITLRDLLTMRSGIPDYTDQPNFDRTALTSTTPDAIVASVEKLPLDFDPGTRWEYSNTNYVLLGIAIQKASAQSYSNYIFNKIIRTLNMTATKYGNTGASSPDLATGYTFDGSRLRPDKPWDLDWADAAGGLVSNVLDVAVWDTALLTGSVVNDTDLREMWTPATLKSGAKVPYGYGWTVESLYGHREIDSNGGLPGYNGRNALFPNDKLDVIVLGNSKTFDAGPVVRQIFELFYPPTTAQAAAEHQGEADALTRARGIFKRLQTGTLDQSQLTPAAAKHLTSKLLGEAKAQLGKLGQPKSFVQTDKYLFGDETVYTYRVILSQGALGLVVSFDPAGKVGSLTVEPL